MVTNSSKTQRYLSDTKRSDAQVTALFSKLYPEAASELNFKNEFELCVAVVLSAQCTDKKVNQVTPTLFERFPDFAALAHANLSTIEEIIRPINYYRTKSKNLLALGQRVTNEFAGKLPRSFEELTSLAGIGRKTANVVLGELGVVHTLPVDTHVFRVAQRLGLAKGTKPEQIEQQLKARFPPELWRPLHHWLILHGRRVCKAQRPNCPDCTLCSICPTGQKNLRQNTADKE